MALFSGLVIGVQGIADLFSLGTYITTNQLLIATGVLFVAANKLYRPFLSIFLNFKFTQAGLIMLSSLSAMTLSVSDWVFNAGSGVGASYALIYGFGIPLMLLSNYLTRFSLTPRPVFIESDDEAFPNGARPVMHSGTAHKIAIEDIKVGDHLVLMPGEIVPVDGVILEGMGMLSGSWITGDIFPRKKGPRDKIFAGERNDRAKLIIQASKAGSESTLFKAVEASKTVTKVKFTDPTRAKLIGRYGRFVFILAIITMVLFGVNGSLPITEVLERGLQVLSLGGSVAIGLIMAFPMFIGSSFLKTKGVRLHDARIGDKARKLSQIILSPINVLINDKPSMGLIKSFQGKQVEHIQMVHAMCKAVNHPFQEPLELVLKALPDVPELIIDFEKIDFGVGLGITAIKSNKTYLFGFPMLLSKHNIDYQAHNKEANNIEKLGHMAVWYSETGGMEADRGLALFEFAPSIRESAGRAVLGLKSADLEVLIAPGKAADNLVTTFRNLPGDGFLHADTVHDMLKAVRIRQQRGESVAFMGASLFDIAAIRAADVSVALGNGPTLIKSAASITMEDPNPEFLVTTLSVCRNMGQRAMANLWGVMGISTLAMVIAILGFMNPSLASFLVLINCLFILINSLLVAKT
jgi:cation transport ATPase